MPAAEVLEGIRVVAVPDAIDRAVWPAGCRVLRIAADDVLVIGADSVQVDDPHAIVEHETMFAGLWMDVPAADEWVARNAEWRLPAGDGFWQGMVAALPVKLLVEGDRALVLVPASMAHELEARI